MLIKNIEYSPSIGKLIFPVFLAFGWLVSTHHMPWPYFNSDFIIAAVLLTLLGAVLFTQKDSLQVPRAAYFFLLISIIPLVQYACGLIEISGQAYIGFIYIFGLFLSIALGGIGEKTRSQYVADIVFAAFLIGSVASVGLQLQQWLELEVSPVVNMGGSSARPYANLGQPNQLATLLMIGISAVIWFCHRRLIGPTIAKIVVVYIAFGLVLTKSLSMFVGLSLVMALVMYLPVFRDEYIIRSSYKTFIKSYIFIFFALQMQPMISSWIQGGDALFLNTELSKEHSATQRISIWTYSTLAVLNSPIFGYGWNQTLTGYLSMAKDLTENNGLIYYAHNLILDILLWCGIPIGVTFLVIAAKSLVRKLKSSINTDKKIALCGVIPFLSHSLFEQPYAYGYLLMPVGVLVGIIYSETNENCNFQFVDKAVLSLATVLAMLALVVIGVDYYRISDQYQRLLYKEMRVVAIAPEVPQTYILNQWERYFYLSLIDEKMLTSDDNLKEIEKLAKVIATPAIYWKKASALAAAGQNQASKDTIELMCKIFPMSVCLAVRSKEDRR